VHEEPIAPLLDAAAVLATLLASRRPNLPRNATESTVLEALRGFGASTRLTFDADTMAVRGHLGTVAALRTECEKVAFSPCSRSHPRGRWT